MKGFKNFHRLLSAGLVVLLLVSVLVVTGVQSDTPTGQYTIDTPWDYPVRPGMAEWETYFTPAPKLKASYVPEDVLKKMTTEALVETVLTYPLLVDMYGFGDIAAGYRAVSSRFSGLPELASRPDAVNSLQAYIDDNISEKGNYHITVMAAETLLGLFEKYGGSRLVSGNID